MASIDICATIKQCNLVFNIFSNINKIIAVEKTYFWKSCMNSNILNSKLSYQVPDL